MKSLTKYKEILRENTLKIFSRFFIPKWVVFLFDNISVFIVFFISYLLRYNFASAEIDYNLVFFQGLIALTVYILFSLLFRSYSGILRHTTLTDITLVFIVTTFSSIVLIVLSILGRLVISNEILIIPISIILIQFAAITVLLFFLRIFVKIIFRFASGTIHHAKRVLIYGAGEMGFIVKRVILSDPRSGLNVVGFLDENKKLQGKKINGLPVFGPGILSDAFIHKHKINTLIIAINNISPTKKSEIIRMAMDFGIDILETPAVDKWLDGQLQVRQLQKVSLEDLLGRDPIKLKMDLIESGLNQKTILVTGAAGSIGSEIVRQLAKFKTRKVILVDQAETPLFHIKNELLEKFKELQINLILADVTNLEKMELLFTEFHPEIVFHAAAYKHVPIMEENPHEALRVNVGGTKTVAELSVKYGVEKFVMISTDKSVNPTSIMGASKRICEMIVQSLAHSGVKTQFVTTRFGNVLGSNGSVIPLFRRQIQDGGPITVTHPEITRYFMTIPEACELVLEAGFMGKGGEIFVFDMGSPVKIVDLAEQMIRLSGLVPGKDIEVKFTGLRPGEKLFEELLTNKEDTLPTHHPKIQIAKVEKFDYPTLLIRINKVLDELYSLTTMDVVRNVKSLVPEFKSSNDSYNLL